MTSQPIVISTSTNELKILVDKAIEKANKEEKAIPSLSSTDMSFFSKYHFFLLFFNSL